MTSDADETVAPRTPHRVTRTMSPTAWAQSTCRGEAAYRVKSGMFSARVALGPMAEVTHWKKTTMTGVPSLIWVGFEKVGPNPWAVFLLISFTFGFLVLGRVLTRNKGPNEQRQAKDRHDERLGHEHVSQATDMQPQQRQLDQNEEEEAQQLRARDVGGCRQVIGEVVELRPDGRDHDGEALAALEGLRPEPDTCYYSPEQDSEIRAAHAERGPG